ncbi:phosphoglycolate phosphatase/putative hydrolase of the HAD superfamily [Hymenobacter luteus]|uniref:phosphoglycolate phosphatase n=2 Tax=Hymenobacter TaxID=89966 RepID=A0A7W9WBU9_9BACT|nr:MULTISPECIES: HAD family hydrolase [Hymenobacter]MBB4602193.1 phosphoglycolate phosphatase/putative hydrolase of the HAD superfamily [Hymenobacter latericoloratus]MBB6059378.1 phosphoglycolate phosphatase/putative hydrolase of the HAD superfamily [Hymenobacter luteus]
MNHSPSLDWTGLRCVIFDVDGTLYAQDRLRKRMLRALLRYYSIRPWKLAELQILRRFRIEREKQSAYAGADLEADQYQWVAQNRRYPAEQVREVVQRWMFQHPNQFLLPCRYPGVAEFFAALRARGITIGIYSDYPAQEKLAALGLAADIIISSTDKTVNRLKPNPQGLLHITRQLGLLPQQCLFIGDRPELDGACAEAAAMPYLIVDKQPFPAFTFYDKLTHHLSTTPTPARYESDIHSA